METAQLTASEAGSTATRIVEMIRDGRFAMVEALFAPPLRAVASAETLRIAWDAETSASGPIVSIGDPQLTPAGTGLIRASVPITGEHGAFAIAMSIDRSGILQGLRLQPLATTAWTPPLYVKRGRFDEREVTLGSGPRAVSGALSLPRGRGPWPGVVLLSGGGPFDRDGTTGSNKPLKDLAWGLASRGIAVVRFDKVTFTHGRHVDGRQVADDRDFTMTDEYVPHAVAAHRLLQQQPTVDARRIFVLGHSMGGKVAPRVAAAEPAVAGLIILAGDAQPMQHAAIRVARYIAALKGGDSDAAVDSLSRQAAMIDSPELSPATPPRELLFGWSGAYWLDLRSYDPVAAAAALNVPMLILQGGRDYQVTVADDLSRWKAGLGDRSDVMFRVYEADNHLFFPEQVHRHRRSINRRITSNPAVIADIAEWLGARRGWIERLFARGRRRPG